MEIREIYAMNDMFVVPEEMQVFRRCQRKRSRPEKPGSMVHLSFVTSLCRRILKGSAQKSKGIQDHRLRRNLPPSHKTVPIFLEEEEGGLT